jgi:hypothetical protein
MIVAKTKQDPMLSMEEKCNGVSAHEVDKIKKKALRNTIATTIDGEDEDNEYTS